ncbi:MAG: NPCBM/NEW2 domain-containing protein [Candidatus Pseudobacter hemicellulosilyticus]|uniref:NPCBM/NEW2 domain-containing protein n=1 Tax=Candidatus Pseudobacter hemicellulosilyticus TaxID=3121375 RepID=A0AAJ6BG02_9BACT|nr:MAG: NPCBM/NEW2 domain-containing protein [Pseudobacter sp.]
MHYSRGSATKPSSMRSFILSISLFFLVSINFAQEPTLAGPSTKNVVRSAGEFVKAYHAGQASNRKQVKVVYFHGNDMDPLPNWEGRLTRILDDISRFYGEAFRQYGIPCEGVPFERSDDQYTIHFVRGDLPSRDYNENSGKVMETEIGRKTAGKIDLTRDHVLVLAGFSYKEGNNTYILHSPYYGTGNGQRGICFAVDCQVLDAQLLTDTVQRMKYNHANALRECTVAEFNSWFIGGIAHEMGHMFGLPHDFGNASELRTAEISLMGQFGSRHFRDYRWRGQQSAVISAAGILQLLSHPVFTQSSKELDLVPQPAYHWLSHEKNDSGVVIRTSLPEGDWPYACYTIHRTADLNEYFQQSTLHPLDTGRNLTFRLGKLQHGVHLLGIVSLYPNGFSHTDWKFFMVGSDGVSKAVQQNMDAFVDVQVLHNRLSKEKPGPDKDLKLQILRSILQPVAELEPALATGDRLSLADARWETGTVGWEKPMRNHFTTIWERTFFLQNQGKIYEKGLYAHAPSVYSFKLAKQWRRFTALAACQDDLIEAGIASFTVWGDGKLLYTSPDLTTAQQALVKIDVSEVDLLVLKAESTLPGNNGHCWSVWLNPLLER